VRRLLVKRADDDSEIWSVEVADSWLDRLVGLIGRKSLDPGTGLYFPGTNSIHMLFMRFAIDCVFLRPTTDKTDVHEVVAVKPNLRPWTGVVWFVRRARSTIELDAGGAAQAGIKVGDRLKLA
jgi:uncharacterized protein